MKNTALTQKHIDLGAKMVPFAGYNMPVHYQGINKEHLQVRESVRSLMFHIWVSFVRRSECYGFNTKSNF